MKQEHEIEQMIERLSDLHRAVKAKEYRAYLVTTIDTLEWVLGKNIAELVA